MYRRGRYALALALALLLTACAPERGRTRTAPAAPGRESMTYLYGGSAAAYLKSVDAAGGAVTTVCPDYFEINPDGSLLITPADKISPALIAELHRREILVTPFLSNHWDADLGAAALENRVNLARALADAVEYYGLDGVNVDIENLNETHREAYTDFVRLLREALPAGKRLTVAVAANPKGWTVGWRASYDYKALAELSDYLMLMTYDESYYGSEPGPISGRTFFEDSIADALHRGVPKGKLVAGLPFFGRFWQVGEAVGGYGIANRDVEALVAAYESQTGYDEDSRSAWAVVTIQESDPKPTLWGGRILTAGTYEIWYDDLRAARYKLEQIAAYDLLGAGSWALGQEDTALWDFYHATLNAGAGQGGVNSNLDWMLDTLNGGGGDRVVTGESILTRADMAVLFAAMAAVSPEPAGEPFADTAGHWAGGAINALKRRGILRGTGAGEYEPNRPVTREELVGVLERLLVLPDAPDFDAMTFLDVRPAMWSYPPIAKFYYYGLMRGYGPDYFGPYDTITAATMTLILDRIERFQYPLNADRLLP